MANDLRTLNPLKAEDGDSKIGITPFAAGTELANLRNSNRSAKDIPYILSENADYLDETLANRRKGAFDLKNKKDRIEYSKRIKDSLDMNDRTKGSELAEYRRFVLTNDVMPSKFALAAFQIQDLSPGEMPLIERPRGKNFQHFTVRSVSYDGGHLSDQWRTTTAIEQLDLETIGTDKVEYPIMDIRTGDISAVESVNETLKFDMDFKIDQMALDNIDAAQTASGLRALLNFHSSIVQANTPDLNYLDLNGTDTGVLTIPKLKTILNHIALLQSAYDWDGLVLKTVMLSPQNVRDSWDFVSLVSGWNGGGEMDPKNTVPESVRDRIFAGGGFMDAWGYRMNWVPNSRIAKGRMYFFFNKPIGWMFTKKQLDRVIRWDESNSPDHAEKNTGEVLMKRVLKFYRPDLWKHRILIVDV